MRPHTWQTDAQGTIVAQEPIVHKVRQRWCRAEHAQDTGLPAGWVASLSRASAKCLLISTTIYAGLHLWRLC